MTINLEQIAEFAENDWAVSCEFEDHGESVHGGGFNGWEPDNVITTATIGVVDDKGEWRDFEVTRDQLMRIIGLHEVRKMERAENE